MALVTLSDAERAALQDAMKRGRDNRIVRRSQALLWLDRGEPAAVVAQRLAVSRQTIYTWVQHFHQRQAPTMTARLQDRPRRGRPATKRAAVQALVKRTPAPKDNPHALPWRSPEARKLLGQDRVAVSTRTIRRSLRILGYRYKRPPYVLARRSPTWRQAKGGSSAICWADHAR
jgi:transposase